MSANQHDHITFGFQMTDIDLSVQRLESCKFIKMMAFITDFPPNEACSKKHMKDRVAGIADLFLVAIDKENGKMAGFLNGLATDDEILKDEFFTDASLHNTEGKNVMLLGLDVMPEYRGQGLARELVRRYIEREWAKGRKEIILTCLESKVAMYEKFGFKDKGIAQSTWGGEEWHEMSVRI